MAESRNLCSDHRSGIRLEHDLLQKDGYGSCYKRQSKEAVDHFLLDAVAHGRYDFEYSKMACQQDGQASGPFQRRNRTCLAARKLNMKPEKISPHEHFMTPITNGVNENQESVKFRDEKSNPVRSSSFCHSFTKDISNTKKNVSNSFVSSGEKSCCNRRTKSCSALPVWQRQENGEFVCSPRRAYSETVAGLQGKDGQASVVRSHNRNASTSNSKDLNALLNQFDEEGRVIAEQENELQRMLLEKQDVLTELSSTIREEEGHSIAELCKELDASKRQSAKLEEYNKTLALKLELEEDLRRNDKECIDTLRKQIREIEDKLQASDRQVRELEHEKRRSQSMCKCSADLSSQAEGKVPDLLKLKYKLELNQATINAIENEYAKLKESKIALEKTNQHDQELLIQLKHQLANSQADNIRKEERINHLEEERQCLEDYQRKCRSLQRRDQKSCYALQLQIVDLQEKLETSERVLKESQEGRNSEKQKIEKLEENLKKLEGKYRTKLEEALNRVKSLKARALKDNLQSTEKFTDKLNLMKAKTHDLEDEQNSFLRTELELQRTSNGASSSLAEGPLNSAFILLEELIKSRGKLNGFSTTKLINSLQEFIKEYFVPKGESVFVEKDVSEEKNKFVRTTKETPSPHHNSVNVQDQQTPFRGPLKVLKIKKVSHEKIPSFESDVRRVKENSSSPRTFQALTSPVSLRKSGKKLLRCMSSQGQGKRETSS